MELSKVTMILRGYTYEQVRCVAEVLINSSYVKNMEITLNTSNAYEIIKKIADEFQGRLHIGAGTVQTYDELVQAMLDYCKQHNVIAVPGAFTPSEIAESLEMGADIVKVFPANEVGFDYAKKLCEPMGELPLMAVGGIQAGNVKKALQSGYTYVGTAGGLFEKEDIQKMRKDHMLKSLEVFEKELL